MDLDKIWQKQDLSELLKNQLRVWAQEVNDALHRSSGGRMISEWAKKPECWVFVSSQLYSSETSTLPEITS